MKDANGSSAAATVPAAPASDKRNRAARKSETAARGVLPRAAVACGLRRVAVRSGPPAGLRSPRAPGDRKSTRLNSSHANISYAVFCLKKKNQLKKSLSVNQL